MTQGYGPNDGQQGQWGQGGQSPQWGQPEQPASQPQWGQPSPAPAASGYPGAAGYTSAGSGSPFAAGDGVNWKRVKLIGLIMLLSTVAVLLVRLGINLATFIGADDMAASDATGEFGAIGIGSSLATLLLYIVNFLLSTVLLVLGIAAAVMGRGRARVGGIIVAAAIPVSVILYWVFLVISAAIWGVATGASGGTFDESSSEVYVVSAVSGTLHALVIVALLALGAFFVHSTASKKLSA